MAHGIHEHNSGLGILINWAKFLENHIQKESPETFKDEKVQKALEGIRHGKERCKEAMDYVYTKFKERHESESGD